MKSMTIQQILNVSGGDRGTQFSYKRTTDLYAAIGMFAGSYTGFLLAPTPFGVPAAVAGAFAGQALGYVGSAALYTVTLGIVDATDALFKPASTLIVDNAAQAA